MVDVELRAVPTDLTAHRSSVDALTGIRFFAAFYVIMFHTRAGSALLDHGYPAIGNFISSGYLAVPLFFLLSGFILAYTYVGHIKKPGDYRRFWEARFARIWPMYAVALFLSAVPDFSLPTPGIMLATICMVQAWNPFHPAMAGAWNFVCWTISVEALFYLCFPRVQSWVEKRSSQEQLLWIGVMLIICVGLNSGSRSLGYHAQGVFLWVPLPLLHLSEFFTGVGLGNYFIWHLALPLTGQHRKMLRALGCTTYVSAFATLALLCRAPGRWTSLVIIAFSGLIFGLATERTLLSRFLSTKAMMLGGGMSYSMYLTQTPIRKWVALVWSHNNGSQGLRAGFLGILISLFLFKSVEEPSRKLLRSVFAKMEDRRLYEAQRRTVTHAKGAQR